MNPDRPKRLVVSGTTGAGKTRLAERTAAILGTETIDLDQLHWGPDWTPHPDFRQRTDTATKAESWVVSGNYSVVRDLTWGRATHVVWLNYPAPLVFFRLLRRTVSRVVSGKPLFAANRETFQNAFLSRESILIWFFKTHWSKQRTYPQALSALSGVEVIEFRRPSEAEAWLSTLAQ